MEVNYCGHQLAQKLWSAAPAYHKKEGVSQNPGVRMHRLQYVGRFEVRVGMRNFGSLSGKEKFVKN